MLEPDLWDDTKSSNQVISNLNEVKEKLGTIVKVNKGYQDVLDLCEMLELEENDELKELWEDEILNFDQLVEEVTIKVILNGEDDKVIVYTIIDGRRNFEDIIISKLSRYYGN